MSEEMRKVRRAVMRATLSGWSQSDLDRIKEIEGAPLERYKWPNYGPRVVFPPGTGIESVAPHPVFLRNEVFVQVCHSDLPEMEEGSLLPTARPLFSEDGSFMRWGIE